MCGIFGIVRPRGRAVELDNAAVARLRDTMARRGPDGAGLWRKDNIVLAHRRLAVIDPTPAADQPMPTPDGGCALVYNGELYNDDELRRDLASQGVIFRTSSDTETVLRALERWGEAALERMRGMYALAFADAVRGRVVLARDPLGMKPLYWSLVDGGRELVFASQPGAVLGHPAVGARPDLVTISAYMTTIRTVLGERTLFAGVQILRPGQVLVIDCAEEALRMQRHEISIAHPTGRLGAEGNAEVSIERLGRAVRDSVRRHLRSDVPLCVLLSGGLDSSIIAKLASDEAAPISTYCSGARSQEGAEDDFACARLMAQRLQSRHTETPISRELFTQRWPEMIDALGVPLGTPNEVAIHEVARQLRADGMVVALSGEGADELFGGYDHILAQSAAYEVSPERAHLHPGEFQLWSSAWVSHSAKRAVLHEPIARALEGDETLRAFYRDEFSRIAQVQGDDPLQAHLRFQRRINLAGLLQRLDTATMLAGVEGRTPFADRTICALAEALPLDLKYRPAAAGAPAATKIGLRLAFQRELPEAIIRRAKASFPLPFQGWMREHAQALRHSGLARELFSADAIAQVAADPQRNWNLAWPMINLALWGQRWWR
jgi:asparagine synthase (glutamine-hydrolysing)